VLAIGGTEQRLPCNCIRLGLRCRRDGRADPELHERLDPIPGTDAAHLELIKGFERFVERHACANHGDTIAGTLPQDLQTRDGEPFLSRIDHRRLRSRSAQVADARPARHFLGQALGRDGIGRIKNRRSRNCSEYRQVFERHL